MAVLDIVIRGAREHNLRNVDLLLPRNQLICFTGVSGSGKSSLAFDTLYAEGQRRYVESLSSFARQFLGQMPKPDVDLIDGLSPSISISQKTSSQSPRSTVGTITEIYDYLRVLYARTGQGHCPQCGRPITAQTRQQILEQIVSLPAGTKFAVLAPIIRGQKGEYRDLFEDLLKQGYVRARVDGTIVRLTDDLRLDRQMRHDIEVVVDRLVAGHGVQGRLAEAVELALKIGEGNLIVAPEPSDPESSESPDAEQAARAVAAEPTSPPPSTKGRGGRRGSSRGARGASHDIHLSAHYACTHCQRSFEPPSPQLFSFNNPQGMCPACDGLGDIYTFDPAQLIPDPAKSFQQGCIELIGSWREMGRWRRHIYRGVAASLERKYGLEPGAALETAWEEVDPRIREKLLWGTGDEHITFTWRAGPSGYKWGGKFEGIIPKLLSQYRSTHSRLQRRMLEKVHERRGLRPAARPTLNTSLRGHHHHHVAQDSRPFLRDRSPNCAAWPSPMRGILQWPGPRSDRQQIAPKRSRKPRRLHFLENVGLDYLTWDAPLPPSPREMHRIRLAGQIGCA